MDAHHWFWHLFWHHMIILYCNISTLLLLKLLLNYTVRRMYFVIPGPPKMDRIQAPNPPNLAKSWPQTSQIGRKWPESRPQTLQIGQEWPNSGYEPHKEAKMAQSRPQTNQTGKKRHKCRPRTRQIGQKWPKSMNLCGICGLTDGPTFLLPYSG